MAPAGLRSDIWRSVILDGLGKADPPVIDVAMLQAQAIWGAVLIVALGALTDLVVLRLDPRVRGRGF